MLSLCACLVSHYFYRYSWLFLLSLSDVPREILVFSPMRSRLQRTAVGADNDKVGNLPPILSMSAPSSEPDTRRANSADTYNFFFSHSRFAQILTRSQDCNTV